MRAYEYDVVDVFTERALEGNPLAVLVDARGLDGRTMQRVAAEFNLSETAFVLPPERGGAARVRIFTPTMEMRFAGHPTLGTAHAALDRRIVAASGGRFALEELVGDVTVRVEARSPRRLWLTTPPIAFGARFERGACARALGLEPDDLLDVPPQLVSAGNPNVYVAVRDRAAVDRAFVELAGMRALHGGAASADCLFVFAPEPGGAYSRMFGPEHGVVEDPATGSATGPLAAYMMAHGLAPDADGTALVSEQGTKMGRRSLLHVLVHGRAGADGIEVGGSCVTVATGRLTLPARS